MSDLRTRLLEGSGTDRELDALVWCALHDDCTPHEDAAAAKAGFYRKTGTTAWKAAPQLLSSIDACLALMEEALPGWNWEKRNIYEGENRQLNHITVRKIARSGEGEHVDLPRAILLAIYDAVEAQKDD